MASSSPCIDAGDDRLPLDPDNTVADQGALFYDQTPRPDIGISSTTLLFGEVSVGESAALPLTVYNFGEENLVLFSMDASDPAFGTDFDPADSLIVPGDSLTVSVIFTPVETGPYIETLTIENNDQPVDVALLGIGVAVGLNPQNGEIPDQFELAPAYPNPFNPMTNLTFRLPVESEISLVVFDAAGSEVSRLAGGVFPAGNYTVVFHPQGTSSGVYFARLTAPDFQQTRTLILAK